MSAAVCSCGVQAAARCEYCEQARCMSHITKRRYPEIWECKDCLSAAQRMRETTVWALETAVRQLLTERLPPAWPRRDFRVLGASVELAIHSEFSQGDYESKSTPGFGISERRSWYSLGVNYRWKGVFKKRVEILDIASTGEAPTWLYRRAVVRLQGRVDFVAQELSGSTGQEMLKEVSAETGYTLEEIRRFLPSELKHL